MDLSKSIEKAKKERQLTTTEATTEPAVADIRQPVKKDQAWQAPTYDESQRVSIDLNVLKNCAVWACFQTSQRAIFTVWCGPRSRA